MRLIVSNWVLLLNPLDFFLLLVLVTVYDACLQDCLMGILREKTIIFVTHQVEFLPAADLILASRRCQIHFSFLVMCIANTCSD